MIADLVAFGDQLPDQGFAALDLVADQEESGAGAAAAKLGGGPGDAFGRGPVVEAERDDGLIRLDSADGLADQHKTSRVADCPQGGDEERYGGQGDRRQQAADPDHLPPE